VQAFVGELFCVEFDAMEWEDLTGSGSLSWAYCCDEDGTVRSIVLDDEATVRTRWTPHLRPALCIALCPALSPRPLARLPSGRQREPAVRRLPRGQACSRGE
jgi:hypothetical protein